MERINEYYLFKLGAALAPLMQINPNMTVAQGYRFLHPAAVAVQDFIDNQAGLLPICYPEMLALGHALGSAYPPNDPAGAHVITEAEVLELRRTARAFDTSLAIQLDQLDTYRVMPKGTHDTRKLIGSPEMVFDFLWKYLCSFAQQDWISASRCMAFDLPTACGFHCLRAMEATVIQYLDAKGEPHPDRNLGAYAKLLKKIGAVQAAVDWVDHLRTNHRNPLMHPDDILDLPEALAVFSLSGSAITCLIKDMLAKGVVIP